MEQLLQQFPEARQTPPPPQFTMEAPPPQQQQQVEEEEDEEEELEQQPTQLKSVDFKVTAPQHGGAQHYIEAPDEKLLDEQQQQQQPAPAKKPLRHPIYFI